MPKTFMSKGANKGHQGGVRREPMVFLFLILQHLQKSYSRVQTTVYQHLRARYGSRKVKILKIVFKKGRELKKYHSFKNCLFFCRFCAISWSLKILHGGIKYILSRAFSTGRALICRCSEQLLTSCSRVIASHRGGPRSIPGRDMSVLGPLVQDGDDL